MFGRSFNGLVIAFWLLTMTWLVTEKVIPPLLGGNTPDYQSALDAPETQNKTDVWKLRWKGQTIGYAASRIVPQANGDVDQCSFVQFDDLPVESLLSELLGPMSAVVKPFLTESRDVTLDLLVATRLRYDQRRQLQNFDTTIDLADYLNFLSVQGVVHPEGELELVARLSSRLGAGREFRHRVQLPPEALVDGSLSPRSELKDLHVGQSWTIPVFRSFPPNSPIQIVEAKVTKYDIILWGNDEVETFEVVYQTDAGSGVNATRRPFSREWVRADGRVLRREIQFSGVEVVFELQGESEIDDHARQLDDLIKRLWKNEAGGERG